jgi:hypothetical protein
MLLQGSMLLVLLKCLLMGNRSINQISCTREIFNAVPSIQTSMTKNAMEDLTAFILWPSINGQLLGSFFGEHISLKNGTDVLPPFYHDTTFFKRTCFLIRLKVLLDGLYVFNGQPDISVPTYLLKRTVEIWMHTKSARATLIFVNI